MKQTGCTSLVLCLLACGPGIVALAQTAPATQPAAAGADAAVTLDFPADGVELKTLADIVSKRLQIPILYDETIAAKRVIIRVPKEVPESSLLGILQSALRMKQMALVDAEQPGWKQIVVAQNLAAVAKAQPPGAAVEPGTAVTQLFALKNSDPTRVAEAIRPFLTTPGGNVQVVPGQRILIVSDYPTALRRIEQIQTMLDSEVTPTEVRLVRLQHADADEVARTVDTMVTNRDQAQFGAAGASGVVIRPDEKSNQIVVIAPPPRMNEVVSLIQGMDQPRGDDTKVYRLKVTTPERLDRLVKNLLGPTAAKRYQSAADRESQSLVVTAPPDVHKRIDTLLTELDAPAVEQQSPMRFYKLKNTKAVDVLATIAGLQGEGGLESFHSETAEPTEGGETDAVGVPGAIETGRVAPPAAAPRNGPPQPPAGAAPPPTGGTMLPRNNAAPQQQLSPRTRGGLSSGSRTALDPGGAIGYDETGFTSDVAPAGAAMSVQTRNATVTADPNTNSIIVIAPPAVQQMYAEVIDRLDQRRPQVQIECTIVTLDTTDGLSFGVDMGKQGGWGDDNQLITFSSFGVSTVDPTTGNLTPIAAPGGTLALLSPGNIDIVIRALATSTHARLVSAPRLLVNDNGKGTLESVTQEPYAQIIDSSSVQAITSFGGQAEAGTRITIEPHISEDDYLQLSYSVELSSFTGQGTTNLPPPAQRNSVESTVTIPDGYTIVVGGLSVKNLRESVNSLPIIRNIPVIKWLFGSRSKNTTDTTLFVFIRPLILRDDRFEDLKYLSEQSGEKAGLPPDFPQSEPIPLR